MWTSCYTISFISECCLTCMTDKWRIEGDYFEACNCDTVCSCIFMGNPDQGQCDLTSAWHIHNGHYENTKLDDLNVAALFHTPGNMFTGPKWKAALYLDERASKEQAEALGKIYSGKLVASSVL